MFSVVGAILISTIVVISGFPDSALCLSVFGSFAVLGIEARATPLVIPQVYVAIPMTSPFCFALVLPLVALSKYATTIILLTNVLNIHTLLSSVCSSRWPSCRNGVSASSQHRRSIT